MLTCPPTEWPAVEAWLDDIVPARVLAATEQDSAFHAEGDVWTHTKLVMESLVALPAYERADTLGRQILATAALLHDIGKPSTTKLENGKLTSRGHSARGEGIARVALWRQGVPFALREHVCSLIRSHQVPFFGITKPAADANRLALALSLRLHNDWLAAVAEADGRGRRCADPADQARIVDHCALWAEHCRELGVLDRPFGFASSHTKQVWSEGAAGARQPDVLAFDDTACEVTLLSGLPGCGKDTWIREHGAGLPVISLDDLRDDLEIDRGDTPGQVIAVARDQARQYLRAGQSFVWNATNLTPSLRGQLLELFRSYRARTRIVYCEVPAAEQVRRNRDRASPVPAAVIERMLGKWSVPDPLEAHVVEYRVNDTPRAEYAAGARGHAWPPDA